MRRISFLLLIPAMFLCACAEQDGDTGDYEFRAGDGDGDVEIHNGPPAADGDDDDDDCLIWDIDAGPSGDSVFDPDGRLLLSTQGGDIRDSSGNVVCTVDGNQLDSAARVLDGDGEVVLTVWHKWVIEGDANVGNGKKIGHYKDRVLYTFQQDLIYDGFNMNPNSSELAGYASDSLQHMSTGRKLLVAALATGECGGPGWPE